MLRRTLGAGGPSLSQITYGSMRMRADSDNAPADLLFQLHDAGIDTHHSSFEYDAHPTYLAALRELISSGRDVKHIVKLAEPGFDEERFDAARLREAVDRELADLGTEQIAVLQLLVRTKTPQDDGVTSSVLQRQGAEIGQALQELQRSGKVAAIAFFPYTTSSLDVFDEAVGPHPICGYLSLYEPGYARQLRDGRPIVALRPFAGAVPSVIEAPQSLAVEPDPDERHATALSFPLLHPAVATVVTSVNTDEHVQAAIKVGTETQPDECRYTQLASAAAAEAAA